MSNSITSLNRREFLASSAMAVAGVTLGALRPSSVLAADGKIPMGLQLYSVRNDAKNEFAGYYDHSAKDIRKMLDDVGLVCCGTHTPYDSVQPKNLKATIEFNRTIGNKYLIVPWMQGKSKEEWLAKAKEFNGLADEVKGEGMFVGYHAHAHDFTKFGDQTAWDIFFGNTKPEVIMQLDTSNCAEGGADPVAVLKKYPGRARTIHLKPNGGGKEAVHGEDKVPWKEVFAFCEGPGRTEWYIVEHESSANPMDAVKRCADALRKMGKM
jgi:sugar phosphate isomerase/epimerase